MGCPGQRVTQAGELAGALAAALRAPGPMLIDVAVDPAIPVLYRKG